MQDVLSSRWVQYPRAVRWIWYVTAVVVLIAAAFAFTQLATRSEHRDYSAERLATQVSSADGQVEAAIWRTVAYYSVYIGGRSAVQVPVATLMAPVAADSSGMAAKIQQVRSYDPAGAQLLSSALQALQVAAHHLGKAVGDRRPRAQAVVLNITARVVPAVDRLAAAAHAVVTQELSAAQANANRADLLLYLFLAAGLLLLVALVVHGGDVRTAATQKQADRRLESLLDSLSDIVITLDSEHQVLWCSSSGARALAAGDGIVGRHFCALAADGDQDELHRHLLDGVERAIDERMVVRLADRAGSLRSYELAADHVSAGASQLPGLTLSLRDVTERLALEQRLRHEVSYDAITGLAGRVLFDNRVVRRCESLTSDDRGRAAVLLFDLDDFKTINDSLGYSLGDALLGAVGGRLAAAVGGADTAARMGGNEFGVLLDSVGSDQEATEKAFGLRDLLSELYLVGGRELHVTLSVGVAVSTGGEAGYDLVRHAAVALHATKAAGRRTVTVYDPGMSERARTRLGLVEEFPLALQSGQFELDYQPIVDLRSGALLAVEALVRWAHPRRGRLYPADFIGYAEETGLICELGEWVLNTACAQAARWWSRYPDRDLHVNVNVSPVQPSDSPVRAFVAHALGRTGLPPHLLVLEITESALPSQGQDIVEIMRVLRSLGVKTALDDFGTGYSALARLHEYPLDILKIDRFFVTDSETDQAKRQLVGSVVELGHALGLRVVVEGVEHRDQLGWLRSANVDAVQGFVFARPMPAKQITTLLAQGAAPFAKWL
ncbi:MAG: putative bifunctional diguanylate cyclase/phosphodiesterase [Solirubrobacteraceae bacterium]